LLPRVDTRGLRHLLRMRILPLGLRGPLLLARVDVRHLTSDSLPRIEARRLIACGVLDGLCLAWTRRLPGDLSRAERLPYVRAAGIRRVARPLGEVGRASTATLLIGTLFLRTLRLRRRQGRACVGCGGAGHPRGEVRPLHVGVIRLDGPGRRCDRRGPSAVVDAVVEIVSIVDVRRAIDVDRAVDHRCTVHGIGVVVVDDRRAPIVRAAGATTAP